MICILKMNGQEIEGWIIATDMHDARRQAQMGDRPLADTLYRTEFVPRPGKYPLPGGYLMLVS